MSAHDEANALEYRRPSTAQLDRIEAMLREVRDALVAQPPVPPGGHPRAHYAAAFPAVMETTGMDGGPHGMTLDGMAMGAIPLPAARGTGIFAVEGPNGELPSHIGTPGAINPDVTDATLKETIGTPNWTATVRPPVSYTNALKIQVMSEYGIVGNPTDFELDHLVPLCAGGNPVSQLNLWAQRRTGINSASVKDLTEVAAQHAILNGILSLSEVQQGFCQDWTALHTRLFTNPKLVASMMMMAMAPPEPEP
jgi:hypothetical protein